MRKMSALAPVQMRAGKDPIRLTRYTKGLGDRIPCFLLMIYNNGVV